ncbi:hypothetical protein F4776DRAFT_195457 [Hypoxylon sp. NC0597]|nr:hypothetical protein F4776DRAFT_195457 [Hypoxylon sp. NC0597]
MTPIRDEPARLSSNHHSIPSWNTRLPFRAGYSNIAPPQRPTHGSELSAPLAETRARHIRFEIDTQDNHPGHTMSNYPAQRGRSGERRGSARFRPPSPYPQPLDKSGSDSRTSGMTKRHVKFALPSIQERPKKSHTPTRRPPSPYPGRTATLKNKRGGNTAHDAPPATDDKNKGSHATTHSGSSNPILTKDELRSKVKLRR